RQMFCSAGHRDRVSAVALRRDGKLLATADEMGAVRWWALERGALLGRDDASSSPVVAAAFTQDRARLVVVRENGDVELFDVATGARAGQPPRAIAPPSWLPTG